MPNPTGYTPRVAIIAGSAKGIGYGITQRLADDGVDIFTNDLPSESIRVNEVVDEIRKKCRRAIGVLGDVSKEEVVKAFVEKAAAELGSVDIMVANAGILKGARFVDANMIKQGKGGRLIAASSLAGRGGAPLITAYSSTKFAVRGLMQTASIELRQHGITANAYAPGAIDTTLLDPFGEGEEGRPVDVASRKFGVDPKVFPPGSRDVVASMVSYLVKSESHHINGQTLSIDGGIYLT